MKGAAAFVLINKEQEEDMPYIYINEGYYFGETEIMADGKLNDKREFTVKALEDCEVLVLKKTVMKKFKHFLGFGKT